MAFFPAAKDKNSKWYLAKRSVVSIYIYMCVSVCVCVYVYERLLYFTSEMCYIPATVTLQLLIEEQFEQ